MEAWASDGWWRAVAAVSAELPAYLNPEREHDALGRAIPRNPFRSKAGVLLLLRLPGFAAQFEKRVPEDYTMGCWVRCVCGEIQAVDAGEVVECAGRCERWFFNTGESIRVARWPREEEDDGG